jgi:hypothetical protein
MSDDREKELAAQMGAVMYAAHKINDRNNVHGGVDNSVDLFAMIAPKGGSYKYVRPDTKEEVIVQPGSPMYSATMMLAEEYYNGEQWVKMGEIS